ncbi:MAG: GTPase [Pseudomonadota bacterium]
MLKVSAVWVILWGILLLPALFLMPLGVLWLVHHELILSWVIVTILIALAGAGVGWHLNQRDIKMLKTRPEVEPSPYWRADDNAAWEKVETLLETISLEQYPITDHHKLLDLGQLTLETVAIHYNPDSDKAILEQPLPHWLKVIELVSRDLRELLDNVPFSHMLTINDLRRSKNLAETLNRYYDLYRLGSFAVNPIGALIRELNSMARGKMVKYAGDELKLWLLHSYVKKVAYYAIQLYSGALTLDSENVTAQLGHQSSQDLEHAEQTVDAEPLRMIVAGQVKAGKSSLINAIFGEMRAMTDVLPLTDSVTPYVLERDGLEQAIVLDTAGYADWHKKDADKKLHKALLESDVILLVCNAVNAARQADKDLLDAILEIFQAHPERVMPPVLIVLSHIDRLRPVKEWAPPYDINQVDVPKANMIRQAMESTADALAIDIADIIPVCLQDEAHYNIEDGVIPAVMEHLDEAQRARYLRCLREVKRAEYWGHLRMQALNAGKLAVRAGSDIATKILK